MTLTSFAFLLLCIIAVTLCHVGGALVEEQDIKPILTTRLQNISRQKRDPSTLPCCLVSSCETIPINMENHEAYKCYKKEVCGDVCKTGQSRRVSSQYSPHTPGYRRRSHYFNERCDSNQCVNYRFDCARCPDPSKSAFSVYTLRGDCIQCYY